MSQLLLGEALARSARKYSGQSALSWSGGDMTYGVMNHRVNALAHSLLEMGVRKGDKVALLMRNRLELLEGCFAAFKIGALAVPINFRLGAKEIEYILNNSDSSVLIMEETMIERILPVRPNLPEIKEFVVLGDRVTDGMKSYSSLVKDQSSSEPSLDLEDDDEALILYTSGTTGRPKGAILTHKNLMMTALNYLFEYQNRAGDIWICITPLFHIAGISYAMTHFYVGATIHLEKEFDPVKTLQLIEDKNVTTLFFVPSMWIRILQVENFNDYNISSVRIVTTAAAIMPAKVKKQLKEAFAGAGFFDCFGGTEAGAVTILRSDDFVRKSASVGQSLPCVEIRLVDEGDRDVPIGEVGEAIYRGPNIMKAYYKNPEATREAMRGGWYHSGDLLRQDAEGFYYVVDRKDDMIISGGENIYPAEIEETLFSHPAIVEAAVVGVPDPEWGQNVRAFVVLKRNESMTEKQVIEYCKSHLASYKKPKSVVFLDSLPKNAAGKVTKNELKQRSLK